MSGDNDKSTIVIVGDNIRRNWWRWLIGALIFIVLVILLVILIAYLVRRSRRNRNNIMTIDSVPAEYYTRSIQRNQARGVIRSMPINREFALEQENKILRNELMKRDSERLEKDNMMKSFGYNNEKDVIASERGNLKALTKIQNDKITILNKAAEDSKDVPQLIKDTIKVAKSKSDALSEDINLISHEASGKTLLLAV